MIFNSILHTIDLFGTPLTINYCGQEKSKSKLGGLCSLLFLGLVGWVTYNGSKDLLSRTNPTTITSESYVENPREMFISPQTFPIAFAMQAPDALANQPFLDESIFKLNIVHTLIERSKNENETVNEKWTLTNIPTERCTPEHFGELYPSFAFMDPQFSFCITRDLPDLKIQGVFEGSLYQSLDIEVAQCDNATSAIPCAPQEILDEYLSGGWFNAIYADMAVDPNNFSRPDSRFRDIYYTMVSPANYRLTEIELGHVNVSSDIGWLIESFDNQKYVKVDKISENLQFKPHPQKVLIHLTIRLSKLEKGYLRTYKKIQNVVAEVGGLANGAMMIFLLLTTHYLKLKVRESLLNEIFDLYIPKKAVKKTIRSEKRMTERINDTIVPQKLQKRFQKRKSIIIKSEEKSRDQTTETIEKKVVFSQVFLSQVDIKAEDINEKPKEDLEEQNNIKAIPKIALHSKSNFGTKVLPIRHSSWREDSHPGTPDKESFRNIISFEGPLSPPRNFANDKEIKTQKVQNKVEALKPKFKILEDLQEENPEDPSLVLAGFTSDDGPIKNDDSNENKEIKVKYDSEKEYKETQKNNKSGEDEIVIQKQDPYQSEVQDKIDGKPEDELKVLDLTIWEYICSFFYQSKSLKQKMDLLSQGINKTDERLDMLNILKKLREVDKLKALLLDNDQLIMFNNLPKPEIRLNKKILKQIETSFPSKLLKKSTFVEKNHTENEALASYERIQNNKYKTEIDKRLLKIFNEKDL